MRTRRTWLISLVSLMLVLGLVLAGCSGGNNNGNSGNAGNGGNAGDGGNNSDQPKQVTITYSEWGTGDQLNQARELLDAFMDEYPNIKVQLEGKDWGNYWTGLTAAASGGALPDVYKMSFAEVEKHAGLGVMEPLDDYIKESGFNLGDIDDSVLSMHQIDGKQMSMPIDANVIMLFFNQALFDDVATNPKLAGYPSANPTWEEIKDIAIKMTLDANNNTPLDDGFDISTVKQWGLSVRPSAQMDTVVEPALISNGGKMFNEDGSLALNTPEAQEVIHFFMDLTAQGINANVSQLEAMGGDAGTALGTGKIAMAVAGNWYTSIYDDAGITYGITQMPSFGGGNTTTVVQPAGVALSPTSKNKDAAWTLISWLAGPEGQKVKAAQGAGLPSNIQGKDAYVAALGDKSAIFFDAHQYGIHSPYGVLKGYFVFTLGQQIFELPFDGLADMDEAIAQADEQLKSFKP